MSPLPAVPSYLCRRISAPPALDGDLTKPLWQGLAPVEFTLSDGSGAPSQSTTVRGGWDGTTLYLGFDVRDTHMRATLTQRDDKLWQEEVVEAFIAPYGDLVHYFEFQLNPLNTQNDTRVTNPNTSGENCRFEGGWDCAGWRTAVRLLGELDRPGPGQGWTCEWAIPLASLLEPEARPVQSGEEWRVGLFRIERWPKEEYSAWSPNPFSPPWFHRCQYFGRWIWE